MFKESGLIYKIFNFIANMMILNFCFIFGSLGILTIGTSLVSTYYAAFKFVDDKSENIIKKFNASYKLNLIQGIKLFIFNLLVNLSLGLYLFIFKEMYLIVFIFILIFLFNNIMSLAYALLSIFDNTLINILKSSFVLFFIYIKRTVFTIIISGAVFYLSFYNSLNLFMSMGIFLIFGFGILIYINALIYKPIINKYTSQRFVDN